MTWMFCEASSFNQPLNDWDVSNVDHIYMFDGATSFNQPLHAPPFSSVKGGYFGFHERGTVDDPNICYVYGKDDTKRNCSEPAAGVENAKTYEAVLPEFEAR